MLGSGNSPHNPRVLFLVAAGMLVALLPAILIEIRTYGFSLHSFLSPPLGIVTAVVGLVTALGMLFGLMERSRAGSVLFLVLATATLGSLAFVLWRSAVLDLILLTAFMFVLAFFLKYWDLAGPNPAPEKFYRLPWHKEKYERLQSRGLFTYEPSGRDGKLPPPRESGA